MNWILPVLSGLSASMFVLILRVRQMRREIAQIQFKLRQLKIKGVE